MQPKIGYFACRGCENPLYSYEAKFNSGCGWPAFDKCYKGAVNTNVDNSYGEEGACLTKCTNIHSSRCNAFLSLSTSGLLSICLLQITGPS